MLIPNADSMNIFQTPRGKIAKQLMEDNQCQQIFSKGTTVCTDISIPEACKDPLIEMSMFAFDGKSSKLCECNSTGSVLPACDPYCGQCSCKPNVTGRKCDKCFIGFYGFTLGCLRMYLNYKVFKVVL